MTPQPPQAARLLEKIKAAFPQLTWHSHRYIDEGWDHEVIVLDERIIFRFAIDPEYQEQLQDEIAVLGFLAHKTGVVLPHYSYIVEGGTFAGYNIVPGIQLKKADYDKLSPEHQAGIARQLAEFLTVIHTLDVHNPALKSVPKSYLATDQKFIKKQMPLLKQEISPEDFALAKAIVAKTDALVAASLPVTFIHNDIYSSHVLWDEQTAGVGIIDFSDMCLGDPAVDFGEIHEYGRDFVDAVYQQYRGPKDPAFLQRAWTYQQWAGVYMMTDYFENHKLSFAASRELFDRVKN
jgi:aminoglycoside phosphotransferase (APT) family kinase protein